MAAPRLFGRLIRDDGAVVVPAWLAPAVLVALRIGLLVMQRQNGEGRLSPALAGLLVDLEEAANRAPAPERSASGPAPTGGRMLGSSRDATEMLTVAQAAERYGSSPRHIRRLCSSRKLPAVRSGRDWAIDSRDLDDYRFRKDRAA